MITRSAALADQLNTLAINDNNENDNNVPTSSTPICQPLSITHCCFHDLNDVALAYNDSHIVQVGDLLGVMLL